MKTKILMASAVALLTIIGGCEKEDANKVVDKAAGAAKDAGKAVGDTAKKATDATKEAAKTAADSMQATATKWVAETVEKQWPEAKKTLDAAALKVPEIKDAAIKTKAEGLLKDLKAQIPVIEEGVAKLKTATGVDLTKAYDDVKAKFDGWMVKLNELKGLVGMK